MSIFLFLPGPALSGVITSTNSLPSPGGREIVNRKFLSGASRGHLDLHLGKSSKGTRAVLGGRRERGKVGGDNEAGWACHGPRPRRFSGWESLGGAIPKTAETG